MFTHYTASPSAIGNILRHGFAWFPNRRKLTQLLIPQRDYSVREPQQFGMISFTEIEPEHASEHCEAFGKYGIVVSDTWATARKVQRVIYVEKEGPVTDALRVLFASGYADVTSKIEYPDDGAWLMAYENKVAASAIAGSTVWAHLLQLWEYLEPAESASQREWRIVNPEPLYSLKEDKTQTIADVSPPQNWAKFVNVLPIPRADVTALVCRPSERAKLLECLPLEYQDIPIFELNG